MVGRGKRNDESGEGFCVYGTALLEETAFVKKARVERVCERQRNECSQL